MRDWYLMIILVVLLLFELSWPQIVFVKDHARQPSEVLLDEEGSADLQRHVDFPALFAKRWHSLTVVSPTVNSSDPSAMSPSGGDYPAFNFFDFGSAKAVRNEASSKSAVSSRRPLPNGRAVSSGQGRDR